MSDIALAKSQAPFPQSPEPVSAFAGLTREGTGIRKFVPVWKGVEAWILMIPLIFFAGHGNFSFEMVYGSRFRSSLVAPQLNPSLIRNVLLPGIAYSVVMWLIGVNARGVCRTAKTMKWLTLLAFLTVLSSLWSQDFTRSLSNGLLYTVDTLFAFYLVLRFDQERLMRLVMMSGIILSLLGLFLVIRYPQFGISPYSRDAGAWQGLFIDRVSAAKCLVFLVSPALILLGSAVSWPLIGYIGLLMLMILKAHAVTALLVVMSFTAAMLFLAAVRRLERKTALIAWIVALTGLMSVAMILQSWLPTILVFFGRDTTLTGRTDIWAIVIRSIFKRPFLGYGFYAFWLGLRGESANAIITANWMFGYAHNGILEIFLQLGSVGAVLFFLTLFQALRNAWLCVRSRRSAQVEWYVGLIVLTILYNIDEATVLWPNELLSILYVVACCGLAQTASKLPSDTWLRTSKFLPYHYDPNLSPD